MVFCLISEIFFVSKFVFLMNFHSFNSLKYVFLHRNAIFNFRATVAKFVTVT